MKRFALLFVLVCMHLNVIALAQRGPHSFTNGSIKGIVIDTLMNKPIEYANIILFSKRDSSQVGGTISDKDGYFNLTNLRPGRYFVEVRFIGFHNKTIDPVILRPPEMEVNLGTIQLREAILDMEPVSVVAERVPVEYRIDKKVINVSKHYTAISGTAVDVLENVPSVTVDIEGNVTLRGSGNFTVLIDNRPTVMDANDALQQIPASAIDNIEIITNPSAKYDPDGTAGIINIILKKGILEGTSGMVNANGGINDKYGSDFIFTYRTDKYNLTIGGDYNHRMHPGNAEIKRSNSFGGITSEVESDGTSEFGRVGYSGRGEFQWTPTAFDAFNIGIRSGYREMKFDREMNYSEWTSIDSLPYDYFSLSNTNRNGQFLSLNSGFQHQFGLEDHRISGEWIYGYRDGDDKSTDELLSTNSLITEGHKTIESGPRVSHRFKLDYTLPIGEKNRFEAGLQGRISNSKDLTNFFTFDTDSEKYIELPQYKHDVKYKRTISSLYTTYSGQWSNLGFEIGLRGEYTYRLITLRESQQDFNIDRWDFFPTFHFSYGQGPGKQLMASYSRRIERSRSWYLEPFETWMDAYNVRKGNPDLKPEYIDSFEGGFQFNIGRNLLSIEAYHRITNNKVERIQKSYGEGVILHSIENIGKDYATGIELLFNVNFARWWTLNLMGNIYNYQIKGKILQEDFSRESNNWGIRLNNILRFPTMTEAQFNLMYNSPSVSSQGKREEFYIINFALKQSLIKNKLSATLQVRDLLKTGKFEFTSKGTDFYSYNHFTREAPVVMLTLTYNFNNYKQQRNKDGMENGDEGEGEFQF